MSKPSATAFVTAVVCVCFLIASPKLSAAPVLSSSAPLSTTGYFQLAWTTNDPLSPQYELQQATNKTFADPKIVYTGRDEASVISGMPDQTYFFRVRKVGGDAWSEVVEVEVKHHPLSRALVFFVLGVLMFIATMTVLIKGARGQS